MSSHRLARLIVGTLPDRIRAQRSEEIVGTLLDAGEDSRIAFMREAASVLGAGVRWRVSQAIGQPGLAVMREAPAWAALVITARVLVISLEFSTRAGAVVDTQHPLLIWGPVAILACFTLGLMTPARVLGVIWAIALLVHVAPLGGDGFWTHVPPLGLALVGFTTMGDITRRSTFARGAWMVPAGFLAVADFTSILRDPFTVALVIALSALLLVPFLPGCALGVALGWASIAVSTLLFSGAVGASAIVSSLELVASVPVVLLALVMARRLAGRGGRSSPV